MTRPRAERHGGRSLQSETVGNGLRAVPPPRQVYFSFGRGLPRMAIAPTTNTQKGSTSSPGTASSNRPGSRNQLQPSTMNSSTAVNTSIAHTTGGVQTNPRKQHPRCPRPKTPETAGASKTGEDSTPPRRIASRPRRARLRSLGRNQHHVGPLGLFWMSHIPPCNRFLPALRPLRSKAEFWRIQLPRRGESSYGLAPAR